MSDLSPALPELRIPPQLETFVSPISDFVPNPWNPNRMDAFTRGKLVASIKQDGFLLPLIVRANPVPGGARWQILDGEHRWKVASEEFAAEHLPYVDVGKIGEAEAKAITIKANALRGEFDAIMLAAVASQIAASVGLPTAQDLLPYTPERLAAMIDLDGASTMNPDDLNNAMASAGSGIPGGATDDRKEGDEFKSFDPAKAEFKHRCPKCSFAFND